MTGDFPLAPLGGLYIASVGVCLVGGALVPRLRTMSVWLGLGLGIVMVSVFAGRLAPAAAPTMLQLGALVAAIVVEFAAFPLVMPRVRPRGERAVAVATLAIVGAHFFVMLPALGPLVALLGLVCMVNAGALARVPGYGVRAAWGIDGLAKVGFGVAMVAWV
jgi:hypothetical protein